MNLLFSGCACYDKANGFKGWMMTFPFFTWGGLFYWIDRYSYSGWRIQEAMWSRRCRLLDPFNIRRASGTFDECYERMNYFLKAWEIEDRKKKAVVLIHGLFQCPSSFEKMVDVLRKQYEPVVFSYPMLRFSLVKSGMALNAMLNRRQDLEQINFVACGMGGLILRQAIDLNPEWLGKIGRSVFMAVPARGYAWLQKWKDKKAYRWLLGEAGTNILPETAQALFPMNGDFGVVIAGKEDEKGINPLFKEDNDGVLTVKDAHCAEAREEFTARDKTHFFLHRDDKLIEMTHNFLNTGHFGSGLRIRKEPDYTNLWEK